MARNRKILFLDLCCCAGGAAVGYYQAAKELGYKIEITGIDIIERPNYPFKFIQADAVDYLQKYVHKYDYIHASPPCQQWTPGTAQFRSAGKEYTDIIQPIREMIEVSGKRGIIENVPQAPVRADLILRGDMFDLKVIRKRHFELINWYMLQHIPPGLKGSVKTGDYVSVFGKASYGKVRNGQLPKFKKNTIRETWAYAMGIDWHMKDVEIAEAIPPAYTKYIGIELFNNYKHL